MLKQIGPAELLVLSLVMGVVTGFVARARGRSVPGWSVLALFVPLLPLLVLVLLPLRRRAASSSPA